MKKIFINVFLLLSLYSLYANNIEELKNSADTGDPDAQYNLAMEYIIGNNIERNLNNAIIYLQLSLKNGNLKAFKMLTYSSIKKLIAEKNFNKAMKELTKLKEILSNEDLVELKDIIEQAEKDYEKITINRIKSNFQSDNLKFNILKYVNKSYKVEIIGYFKKDDDINRSKHTIKLNNYPSSSGGKGEYIEAIYSNTDKVIFFADKDFDLDVFDYGIWEVKVKGYLTFSSSTNDISINIDNIEIAKVNLTEAKRNADIFLRSINDTSIEYLNIYLPNIDKLISILKNEKEYKKSIFDAFD